MGEFRSMKARDSLIALALVFATMIAFGFQRTSPSTAKNSQFSEERAAVDLQTMVGFGPRPAGSDALSKTRIYIISELKKGGLEPQLDEFDARTPLGVRHMVNIRAVRRGTKPTLIAITGHYDTKYFPNIQFVGASDGGSSAAWLL